MAQEIKAGRLDIMLSARGLRASFFHVGVLAKMAELSLLRHVDQNVENFPCRLGSPHNPQPVLLLWKKATNFCQIYSKGAFKFSGN